MKTFEDLDFKPHFIAFSKRTTMSFENEYGVSVLLGKYFFSNGKNTYELAILHKNQICYDTEITNDVLKYITSEEVTEIMKKIQKL